MHEEKKDAFHTRIPYAHLGSEATPSPFLFFPALMLSSCPATLSPDLLPIGPFKVES